MKGFTGDLRGRLEALEQVTRQARQSTTAAGQGEGFVSSHRGRVANVLQFYRAGLGGILVAQPIFGECVSSGERDAKGAGEGCELCSK